MKLVIALLLFGLTAQAQINPERSFKWHMDKNKYETGGLLFLAGASKGFNETLLFHWKAFRHTFPKANSAWFNPNVSWTNKYKNGDPNSEEDIWIPVKPKP